MVNHLHICFIVYTYEKKLREGQDLLSAYYSLTGWCNALVEHGCKITVLLRFHKKEHIQQKNIDYYFLPDAYGEQLRPWQIPWKLHEKAKRSTADVFHSHNMDKVLQHAHLKKVLGPSRPLIVQNHAETPRKWLRIGLQRIFFKKIDAFLFCAKGQEETWLEKSLISTRDQVFHVMEASTHFIMMDRQFARQKTQMTGEPVFLWVGNLDSNKDPLTVLEAFYSILLHYPAAKLYMIYRFDTLFDQVSNFITKHKIDENVFLLGAKSYQELEVYYNSADYFILGSHREGSGYSVMESMACGCIPIVTDIPSFRMMTNDGQAGYLWEVGNQEDLIRVLGKALKEDRVERKTMVKQFFEKELSYPAIANKMIEVYCSLIRVP